MLNAKKEVTDMSYPKPLQEKTIRRRYNEAGITSEQISFLHRFFTACSNLYGALCAYDAWEIYKKLVAKTQVVQLHRKDLYAALGILRRETVPYYVYEEDEVYSDGKREDKLRVIANRDLISPGYGKFAEMYHVMDTSAGKPFYVPSDLLEYEVMPQSEQEKTLLRTLEGMKVTSSIYKSPSGKSFRRKNKGKYLGDFSYDSAIDEIFSKLSNGALDVPESGKSEDSVSAAQYLVDKLKHENSVGYFSPGDIFKEFFDNLSMIGVELRSETQASALMKLIADMWNNQHIWCNRGWTPSELYARSQRSGMPTISFGPGMQKSFADGSINKQDLTDWLTKHGFGVKE